MIAGCYMLDLYCDNYDPQGPWPDKHGHAFEALPHQYTDELGSNCRKNAQRAGWKLTKDGRAFCPQCSGKLSLKTSVNRLKQRETE